MSNAFQPMDAPASPAAVPLDVHASDIGAAAIQKSETKWPGRYFPGRLVLRNPNRWRPVTGGARFKAF